MDDAWGMAQLQAAAGKGRSGVYGAVSTENICRAQWPAGQLPRGAIRVHGNYLYKYRVTILASSRSPAASASRED